MFEYLVMLFGLTNAPATFQHLMNDIFHDLINVYVVVYLDDILIYSDNIEQHREHVCKVLRHLCKANLHVRPEKCNFHTMMVEYLGVIVSPEGIAMDPSKIQTILGWPAPLRIRDLQSFLGFANFYRRFIDNYSGIVIPLTHLLHKDTPWKCSPQFQEIFDILKQAFTEAPLLQHYDPDHPITLECDASDYVIAAILS